METLYCKSISHWIIKYRFYSSIIESERGDDFDKNFIKLKTVINM